MKAIISGQAGIAVLAEGSRYWSVSVAEPDLRKTCAPESIHFLFAGADDVISVEASEGEVLTRLTTAWQMDRALQMTLILLDRDEDQDLRETAAECLEEFLAKTEVSEFVANRLHESPLPEDADINVAIDVATNLAFSSAAALLKEVRERQAVIQLVSHAFSDLDDQFFGAETFQSKAQARRWFSDRGVFRKLAKGHGPSIGNEVMKLLSNPEIASIPRGKALILKWMAPLKSPALEMDYSDIESEESNSRSKTRSTKQSVKRSNLRAHESKALVDRQLVEILALIENGDDVKALQWASDVFQRQVDAGEEPFAVKSMSKLAIQMKQRGRSDLQLRFATMAANSKFADAQALNQLADALLQSGDAVRALRQYDETIVRFGNDIVARNGRAEVLRELGRFEDALQQYEQTIDRFSDNVVARNGRAEVLRQLGRLEDALQQYQQTIVRFGNDIVARNGRAEVLRELGRLEDALQQYEQTIDRFSDNDVARNGRAEVLRQLGRFEDALQQYEQTIANFGNDVFAQCGRAEVLRELGRFGDALQQYEQTINQFSDNVVAQCGRAEVLRELGRFDDALQQYEHTINRFSNEVVARNGRAEVLRELGRFEDALLQYEQTINRFSDDVVAQCGRAEVLRELGRFEDALQQHEQTINRFSNDVFARNGRAEVLRELGRFEDALQQYEQNIDRFTNNVVAQCGRAEVLRELGRFEDALQQYKQTIEQFGNNRIAKNGCAVTLLQMERYDEALNQLGAPKFVIGHDWIDFHVRGMVHLRRGDLERALEIFEYGASRCQFRQHVPYFKSAVALVRLRMKDSRGALEAVQGETGPLSDVIRMHAFGEQLLHEECKMTYASLERQTNRQVLQIRSLLYEGYLSEKATIVRTAAWEEDVFFKELHLLLMNAA